jgi:SAM-dependent methyltransferase
MRLLAPYCRRIVGVDISQPMLEVARGKLHDDGISNAELYRRSATDLGFPAASFDLVYAFSILLLVPNVDRALAEIHRVLRPNGIAILDITGRWNLSRVYWGMYYRRQGHFGVRSFDYRRIDAQLNGLGLSAIESHALGFLDQWRYIPGLHWCKGIDRLLHRSLDSDIDYRVSNWPGVFRFANRWYMVCKRIDGVTRSTSQMMSSE